MLIQFIEVCRKGATPAASWFFSFSAILLYICCLGSLPCYLTTFLPSFSFLIDDLIFDSTVLWHREYLIVDLGTTRSPGLWLQNKLKPSHLHHCARQLEWGVDLVFTRCGFVQFGLCSHISSGLFICNFANVLFVERQSFLLAEKCYTSPVFLYCNKL